MVRVENLEVASTPRLGYIDKARGLAIALMFVDHLCVVLHGPTELRNTFGRLAMPLFFLVSGALVRRFTARHALIACVGLLLPLVVPWLDSPNVLVLYVIAAAIIATFRHLNWPLWPVVAFSLLLSANFFTGRVGTSFEPFATIAIAALGAQIGTGWLRIFDRLPAPLALIGRYPLTCYVGHLLLLSVVGVALGLQP